MHYRNLFSHYRIDFSKNFYESTFEKTVDLILTDGPLFVMIQYFPDPDVKGLPQSSVRTHCGLKLPATRKKSIASMEFVVVESVKCGLELDEGEDTIAHFIYTLEMEAISPKPLYISMNLQAGQFSKPSLKDKERIEYWKKQAFQIAETFRWE